MSNTPDLRTQAGQSSRQGQGDPVADYVDLWMELERIHQERRLTEEGWAFLGDHLQRPIEMRLMERRPISLTGAAAALDMAAYILENFESDDQAGDAAWYRRLRRHLIDGAKMRLEVRAHEPPAARPFDLSMEPQHCKNAGRTCSQDENASNREIREIAS